MTIPQYKHYSFDLWLTLIKSNPAFKPKRIDYFYERFNYQGKSWAEVAAIFRNVDVMANRMNEKTGKNIDVDELYFLIISLMNDYLFDARDIDLEQIYADLEVVLLDNLPLIYSENTPKVLQHLAERDDCTVGLLSNTGFIKGVTLRKVLNRLQIGQYFDFQMYSDEEGMSKPNEQLFGRMLQSAQALHSEALEPSAILHIGDNPIADIAGAKKAGMVGLFINFNAKEIAELLI